MIHVIKLIPIWPSIKRGENVQPGNVGLPPSEALKWLCEFSNVALLRLNDEAHLYFYFFKAHLVLVLLRP